MPSTSKGSGAAYHFRLSPLVETRRLARANGTGRVNGIVPHSAQEPHGMLCPFLDLTHGGLGITPCSGTLEAPMCWVEYVLIRFWMRFHPLFLEANH